MKKGVLRAAAFGLACTITVTGFSIPTDAALLSSILPAAGGALVVGEGVSVKQIEKVKRDQIVTKARNNIQTIQESSVPAASAPTGETADNTANTNTVAEAGTTDNTDNINNTDSTNNTNNTTTGLPTAGGAVVTVTTPSAATASTEQTNETATPTPTPTPGATTTVTPAPATETSTTTEEGAISDNGTATVTATPTPTPTVAPTGTTQPAATGKTPVIEVLTEEEKATEDFSSLMIAQVSNYVNIRDAASEDGEVVGKLYNNSAGEWLGAEGDWYKIKSGNVEGYVKSEFVVTGDAAVALAAEVGHRVAVVTTTTLKVRQDPSTEAIVLGLVPIEDELTVVEETENWVKVSIEEGDGWVSKEFVDVSTEFVKAESKAEEEARLKKEEEARKQAQEAARKAQSSNKTSTASNASAPAATVSGSGTGSAVANYALQFVGNPYVYGGTSLTSGTDCSGFTMGVYRNFGVSLPHSSGAQRGMGYDVGGIGNAQPGDIVCYSGHVGIYIGGGQIVHASTAATGIKVSNAGYRSILSVRRIF